MKKISILILALFPILSFSSQSPEETSNDLKEKLFKLTSSNRLGPKLNYKTARMYLFGSLHLKRSAGRYFVKDAYCNKVFTSETGIGPMKIPDHLLINCEHTWPQSRFNRNFLIRLQKNDLHHLFPVDAKANSTRLNDIFAEVNNGKIVSNDCTDSVKGKAIGSSIVAFEPPNHHKGNVARAIFYFSIRYKSPISALEESYLRSWHEQDPVDDEERIRNQKIREIQKNTNPFIDDSSLVSQIYDF